MARDYIILEGREIELWERIVIAYAGRSIATVGIAERADNLILERRLRVKASALGPYREAP